MTFFLSSPLQDKKLDKQYESLSLFHPSVSSCRKEASRWPRETCALWRVGVSAGLRRGAEDGDGKGGVARPPCSPECPAAQRRLGYCVEMVLS